MLFAATFTGCSESEDDFSAYLGEVEKGNSATTFINHPLPEEVDTLRILSLGNSYSIDILARLGEIIESTGIPARKYSIYMICRASCSLAWYADALRDNKPISLTTTDDNPYTLYHLWGTAVAGLSNASEIPLQEVLSKPWDVVVLQQNSANSVDYNTYSPYLEYLICNIKELCPNSNLSFVWNQTWSYGTYYGGNPCGEDGYDKICQAVSTMKEKDNIDIIVPAGTALQNMRNTIYNDEYDLTRDGIHLNLNVGRYTVALAFYATVIAPVFGKSIDDVVLMDNDLMTADCFETCRQSVKDALTSPFNVTVHEDPMYTSIIPIKASK